MVIGLLVIAGIPTTIGVCEALSAQKKANAAAKEKAKFHLTAAISLDGGPPVECFCVLRDGRLWIDHPDYPMPGHKFMGYYFTYPSEEKHLGMVSTIADDPPMLNWIYCDKDTGMVKHGGRQATIGHTIGPWYWSNDEVWLTLEGDTLQFVAVQDEETQRWCVYWDKDRKIRGSSASYIEDEDYSDEYSEEDEDDDEDEEGSDEEDDPEFSESETEEPSKPTKTSEREPKQEARKVETQKSDGQENGGGETGEKQHDRETEDKQEDGGEAPALQQAQKKPVKWVPILLRRRMQLGMESRYVKGANG
ncbi:hypothetical protein B0T20DRAFT_498436 [Sordaria brevicollis]|uniref:Uncharacterized protein n=1 Tax=Sordaria brevicollis TaxID=83679 RepID=A0AAE0PEI8_SORBR|nr:hypothetical protein B0T20DRAFT_498436 [Sordaria brevicollis]